MNLYIEFKNFDPEDLSDRWQSFCRIFPLIVSDDRSLKELVTRNGVEKRWQEIKDEYLMALNSELMYIVFTKSDEIQSHEILFDHILGVCQNMMSRAVLAALTPELKLDDEENKTKGRSLEKMLDTILNHREAIEKKQKTSHLILIASGIYLRIGIQMFLMPIDRMVSILFQTFQSLKYLTALTLRFISSLNKTQNY